jgi:hypothetical protein
LETLALQWARTRVTPADLDDLTNLADLLVEAELAAGRNFFGATLNSTATTGNSRQHVSRRPARAADGTPLAFVVLASDMPRPRRWGASNYVLVDARGMREPEFTEVVRRASRIRAPLGRATASSQERPVKEVAL